MKCASGFAELKNRSSMTVYDFDLIVVILYENDRHKWMTKGYISETLGSNSFTQWLINMAL